MKYKKNKLGLNEMLNPPAMRGFYFLVKFYLVLIYILKVCCKRSSSILLRKNLFNALLVFFFWKACTFSNLSVENLETTLSTFLSKFSCEINFSRIINYWGSMSTLFWTWGVFSLVCVLSALFFLSFFFFSFSIVVFLDRD